jgi:RNA polymerase sigma-70 factor (ECF subfamily)
MENPEKVLQVSSTTNEALRELTALRRFAYRLCRDEEAASDLVQETMLRAWRSLHTYRPGSNCRAWLFQICKNLHINECRRRKFQPLRQGLPGRDGDDTSGRDHVLHGSSDDSRVAERGLGDEVIGALNRLPVEYRTAVLLSDLEDLTYEEIAAFTRAPIGTVRSRIHRGRRLLAQRLGPFARKRGLGHTRKAA